MTSLRIAPPVLLIALVALNVLAVAIGGLVAVSVLIVIDELMLIAAAVGALLALERAERLRRETGYVISQLDYPGAPRQAISNIPAGRSPRERLIVQSDGAAAAGTGGRAMRRRR